VVRYPTAPPQPRVYPQPTIAGPLHRDPVDLIPQIQVKSARVPAESPAVKAGSAHRRQFAQPLQRTRRGQIYLFFDVRVGERRIVNACSFRCSSTCCPALAAALESFDTAVPQLRRQRCSTFGFTSQALATSRIEAPVPPASRPPLGIPSCKSFVCTSHISLFNLITIEP
jgi:hypothetical protein